MLWERYKLKRTENDVSKNTFFHNGSALHMLRCMSAFFGPATFYKATCVKKTNGNHLLTMAKRKISFLWLHSDVKLS